MKQIDKHACGPRALAIRAPSGLGEEFRAPGGGQRRPTSAGTARFPVTTSQVKENPVKFMLQVRFNGADAVIGELPPEEQEKVTDEFVALRESDGVIDGNQLRAAGEAATVRVKGGQTRVTAGPPVDERAALNGYYVYDAPDLGAAITFAARIPAARFGATIEVREMMER